MKWLLKVTKEMVIYARLCATVFFSHTKPAPASSHQPASSTFLSQQIITSHSTANRDIYFLKLPIHV